MFDNNVLIFSYMFIYNTSLILLFWTLFTFFSSNFKTLHSFTGFSLNSFYLLLTTILLFSMAGVPPFIGFFSKLFILVLLVNSSFFQLYSIFLVTLFLGLYFYMQNIRFLHTSNLTSVDYQYVPQLNERLTPVFYYSTLFISVFLVFGFSYVDDLLLFFTWIFC